MLTACRLLYLHDFEDPRSAACLAWCAAASHIDYLVTTRSRLPGWSAPEVAVRRRFRDFVALAELLKVCKVY
jgi:hypothetical protein